MGGRSSYGGVVMLSLREAAEGMVVLADMDRIPAPNDCVWFNAFDRRIEALRVALADTSEETADLQKLLARIDGYETTADVGCTTCKAAGRIHGPDCSAYTTDAPPSTNSGEVVNELVVGVNEEMVEDLEKVRAVVDAVITSRKGSIGSIGNTYMAQIRVDHGKAAYEALYRLRAALAAAQKEG